MDQNNHNIEIQINSIRIDSIAISFEIINKVPPQFGFFYS